MVLGADHEHVDLVIDVVTFQIPPVGGVSGCDHILAAQIAEALDTAVIGRQQLTFDVDEPLG